MSIEFSSQQPISYYIRKLNGKHVTIFLATGHAMTGVLNVGEAKSPETIQLSELEGDNYDERTLLVSIGQIVGLVH